MFVTNWFPPVISGSSYYAYSLARSLADRGHELSVVTLDWGEEYAPLGDVPFPVYRLPVMRLPKLRLFYNLKLMGAAYTPGNVRRLKALVARHQPQILHHVNHIFDTTFLSVHVAHAAGIPVVGSITTPIQHQSAVKQRIMALVDQMTVGWFGVCRWDGVVSLDRTVHDYVGKMYGRRAQKRSRVIPFSVPLQSMPLYDGPPVPRSERPQVLMVGHIHPFRNPVQLVRAMPLVLKAVPNARLVLVGRVDLAEPVEVARQLGLSDDQVVFLGERPREEVVHLVKTSHVFASWVTGPYHSLGTAPMEAMLCETPVVNDFPEDAFGEGTLKDGENIVMVNSRDPESIAKGLIRLLQDEKYRQKIGSAGRRFVLEHLSWSSIAAQMEGFYEDVLREKRSQ
jgi:glycosyltransferase involved in cell wall biosynthesis